MVCGYGLYICFAIVTRLHLPNMLLPHWPKQVRGLVPLLPTHPIRERVTSSGTREALIYGCVLKICLDYFSLKLSIKLRSNKPLFLEWKASTWRCSPTPLPLLLLLYQVVCLVLLAKDMMRSLTRMCPHNL